jgi:formiminotetrahydrofolate cyclodeaminase
MMADSWDDMTLREFQAALASSSPTPGGGTAAAIALGQSAALACMVCDLTLGNEKWQSGWSIADKVSNIAIPLFSRSLELASEDSAAFDEVMAAFKMAKDDDEQIDLRRVEIRRATLEAARTPLETARLAFKLLSALPELATHGNANAVSDVGVASLFASTACKGALMNVEINLSSLPIDMGVAERAECEQLKVDVSEVSRASIHAVQERL